MTDTTLEPKTVEVDPKGDVIFVCNTANDMHIMSKPEEKRVRASSAILMTISSVFASMLGPHFKEGQQLRTNLTVEIAMPDDPPKGLIVLLSVLHLKSAFIPSQIKSFVLLDVARLADKYLCVDRIEFAARIWMQKLKHIQDAPALGRLIRDSIQSIIVESISARDNFSGSHCLPSCHIVECGLYELMRHLHANHLNEGEFRRQTLDDTLDTLEEMPDFPFSDRSHHALLSVSITTCATKSHRKHSNLWRNNTPHRRRYFA